MLDFLKHLLIILKHLLIMTFNFLIAMVIAFGVFKWLAKDLTGTGTGEIGQAIATYVVSGLVFIIAGAIIGAIIYGIIL